MSGDLNTIVTFITFNNGFNLDETFFYSDRPNIEGAIESFGYNVYHGYELNKHHGLYIDFGDDYDTIMSYPEYDNYVSSGLGYVSLYHPNVLIYTKELEYISSDEYDILPDSLKEKYISYRFDRNFTSEEMEYLLRNFSGKDILNIYNNDLNELLYNIKQ